MSKLLDDVRSLMRVRHYSYQTERVYLHWIRQYIFFHKIRHPKEMGTEEIEAFLTHLAVDLVGFGFYAESGAGCFAVSL